MYGSIGTVTAFFRKAYLFYGRFISGRRGDWYTRAAREVKVYPTTDEPKRYEVLKDVVLDTGKERLSLKIAHVRFFKQIVIVKFAGLNDINEVEGFKGAKLYVSRENALELREDEYYFADLAGLRVQTEEGEQLGIVKDILQTGANDVYVVGREHKRICFFRRSRTV